MDSIKDARNNLTTIGRDGFGRALQVNYPNGSFESYTFDISGNPLTHRMRNGNVITNTFDALGRIVTKSPQGQAVVTFSYDNASRLLSVSTPVVSGNPASGVFSHGYDTAGRLISETNPQSQVMSYLLDPNGNAVRITHPGGYFVERVYDQLDRLTNIKLNGSANSAVVFGYDQLSRRVSKNYLNGANTTYSYDLGNNLLTMNIGFIGSACNWNYTYNKVHQMLSSICSDTNYYWRATAGTVNYAAANNLNQYPTVGALAATYNTLGALATYNTWTYTYNTEQMLTAASKTGTSASFVYDPKLRQIQKTVGSTKTKYVYSGSHMMEERNGATNALTRRYVYAGADEPVLQMTAAGVVTYIHHDHHGSVIAQSNATTGAVGNIYKYGPFGESAATLPGTTIGYTGQRYDTELGLYHYKARYFHQGLGRFLQPDPIGYSAGMNLYAYCSNDGLNHTDPDGLMDYPDNTNPATRHPRSTYGRNYIVEKPVIHGEVKHRAIMHPDRLADPRSTGTIHIGSKPAIDNVTGKKAVLVYTGKSEKRDSSGALNPRKASNRHMSPTGSRPGVSRETIFTTSDKPVKGTEQKWLNQTRGNPNLHATNSRNPAPHIGRITPLGPLGAFDLIAPLFEMQMQQMHPVYEA